MYRLNSYLTTIYLSERTCFKNLFLRRMHDSMKTCNSNERKEKKKKELWKIISPARQIITDTLSHAFSNLSEWQAIFQLRFGKSVDSTGETRSATKTLITITRPRFEAECGGLAATLVAFHSLFLPPPHPHLSSCFPTTNTNHLYRHPVLCPTSRTILL